MLLRWFLYSAYMNESITFASAPFNHAPSKYSPLYMWHINTVNIDVNGIFMCDILGMWFHELPFHATSFPIDLYVDCVHHLLHRQFSYTFHIQINKMNAAIIR